MDHSIEVHDSINVSDHVKVETEIDAVIYRQEFESHLSIYMETQSESELIFTFIYLQIYIECFLHQNMRRIVNMVFKPPRENISSEWMKKESRKVRDKIDAFGTIFHDPMSGQIQGLVDTIKNNFSRVSYIRNQFAHGHKVSAWSDSDGKSGKTSARELLTNERLAKAISEVNELGFAWNTLLDNILPQCKSLRTVEDFKYTEIQES